MKLKNFLTILFLALCGINQAFGATSDWSKAPGGSAQTRLVASFYEKDGKRYLIGGIHFKISRGWKIYGNDSSGFGLPPQLDFSGSTNYKSHKIIWPKTQSAEEKIGNETIKYSFYKEELVLPIEIQMQTSEEMVELKVKLDYGICKDICIPASSDFVLKVSDMIDEDALEEIQKFYPTQTIIKLKSSNIDPASGAELSNKMSHDLMLFYSIIFALIGGAILNIMPCVLPVLSIKLMSILKHSNTSPERIRFAFISTTIGILSCFVFFALLAIAIKLTGNVFGWGLQFQNPYFLIFLVIILTLFSANLLGLFEISFEQVLATILHKKISESEGKKNIFIPNFLSGVLAVLLATPCSAPFLGSAISFALVSGFGTIFVIFLSIGIGFASPYIALSISQKLINYLPKPGMWMIKAKQLMALFLIATIIWLIYILSHNISNIAASIILLVSIAITLCLTIKSNLLRYLTLIVLVISAFALPTDFKNKPAEQVEYDAMWKEFREEDIAHYVAQGKVVIVDITADWCLTCKFNKIRILHDDDIMTLLKRGSVIGLRGNITKPDEKIMDFLHRNNRFAIPFNAVYGPNSKEALLASELLSKTELLELIKKAQAPENKVTE